MQLCGTVFIAIAGRQVEPALGGRQCRILFAYLVLHRTRAIRRDELMAALWPVDAPANPAGGMDTLLSRLRKALGADVVRGRSELRLCLPPGAEVDVETAAAAVGDAETALDRSDWCVAMNAARTALDIVEGGFMPEADLAWIDEERRRIEELRLRSLECLAASGLGLGGSHLSMTERAARTLIDCAGYRETGPSFLMQALAERGRIAEAVRVFDAFRVHVQEELGMPPGASLRALHERLVTRQVAAGRHQRIDSLAVGAAPLVVPDVVDADVRQRAAAEDPFPLPTTLSSSGRDALVGRKADLDHLERCYRQTRSAGPRLTLIYGEPGIGKTRLATELGWRARADGAVVLYGRCDEEPVLPHQPFIEALRHYVAAAPLTELTAQMRPISGELRSVLPELTERVSDLPEPLSGDPDGARYRLFEAISSLLCRAAQSRPVVMVLDDLHWADTPTLLLLRYLMRYAGDASLLVLGTYRHDLDAGRPFAAALAGFGREHDVQRRELARLDLNAVAQLVDARAGGRSHRLTRAVYDRTEGNPFFVVEMLRHLSETGLDVVPSGTPIVPQGVNDVISRRLARLSLGCGRVLSIAAVAGQTFELAVLERVSNVGETELLDRLEEAAGAQIIEETTGALGRYAFAHALIRETIYANLSATRRALLHRRVAAALEEAQVAELRDYSADLAHHFVRAGTEADLDKAIEYATRAGERALSMLAYEQAAAHFRQAAALLEDLEGPRKLAQRCTLLLLQGEAERHAGDPAYRQTLLGAAAIAQELGDPKLLCRAALSNTRGSIFSSAQGVDRDRVSGLERALEVHGPQDSPIRARLVAHLAMELVAGPDWVRREELADEALGMAHRLGDTETLASVLNMRCNTLLGPRVTQQRRAHAEEAASLADELDDPIIAAEASIIGAGAALEAGDLLAGDRLHARYAQLTKQLGIPHMRWYERSWRVKRSLIAGAPREAEQLAFETVGLGQEVGQPDAFAWFLSQIGVARLLQGTLDSGEPNLPDLFALPVSLPIGPELTPSHSVWLQTEVGKSSTFCGVGRMNEGRRHFEAAMANNLEDLPRDYAELWIAAQASLACVHLQDRDRAPRLRALIEPYADCFVDNGPAWAGATSHYLGRLCAMLEDLDEADACFDGAARSYERIGARAWLIRAQIDWAEMLRVRRRTGDLEQADGLLRCAWGAAHTLGLERIERRIARLQRP